MKKFLFSFLAFLMLASVSFANCSKDCNQNIQKPNCQNDKQKNLEIEDSCLKKTPCDVCPTEDDEYCVYNQCYFDKRYRKMKEKLSLSKKQETMADNLYKTYKADMECICNKYKEQKDKVLEMIDCHNGCWRDEAKILKEIKSEAKERTFEFRDDIKEILCQNQYKAFRQFQKSTKKKIKRIIKYGAIYKFPCASCK